MKEDNSHPDDIGPFKMSLSGALFSIVIGGGMLVLTYFMTKAMVRLIRDNDHFSVKQLVLSVVVFVVFFSSGTLFVRRGVRRLKRAFTRGE